MKGFLAILLVVISTCSLALAQEGSINGKIQTTTGDPIPYCNILIKGSAKGTTTSDKGEFVLQQLTPGNYTLLASAVGYESASLTVTVFENKTTEVEISLAEKAVSLSEVVVSASRTPETLDEVPSSVTILSRKSIEDDMLVSSNVIDILSNKVPGLAPSTGTSSNWGQTLRGRAMLIMIDGVPQSTPLRNGAVDMRALDPDAIERIEVIKGATAIYGNGAAGGLINYITRTPKQHKVFSSRTTLGVGGSLVNPDNSMGTRISQMFYGKKGKIDYVVSGVHEQTGEFKDAEGDVLPPTYGLGETDSYNAFLKLGYDVTSYHRLQLTYNFYSSEQKTNYVSEYGNYQQKLKTKAVLGEPEGAPQGVRANHNLNLRFSGEKAFLNSHYEADIYFQSVDNVFFQSPVFVDGGQSRILSEKKGARLVFNTPISEEKQLQSDITYGVDLLNDVTSQPLVDGRIWVPEMNMINLAPFVQVKINLLEALIFKGGVRSEQVNISVEDYTTLQTINRTTGEIDNPGFDVKGGELSYNTRLYNLGLRLNSSEFFTPYVSYSQGFSVADLGIMLRAAKVDDIKDINTKAIVIKNYEAGFVSKYNKFRFEGVAFISTSKLGASGKFENGVYQVMRSPEKIYGFEAIADVTLTNNINAGASYAFVEGKVDGNDNKKFRDQEDRYLGGERISPPKYTAYLKYQTLANKLGLNLQYTGVGIRDRFEKNEKGTYNVYEGPIDPYHLVNFSASYKLTQSTTLSAGVENLLNEDYFPARSQWFTQSSLYTKGKGASFNVSMIVEL